MADRAPKPLPGFFERLYEAKSAAEAVDNFDVCSRSPASVEQFNALVARQNEAALELIHYVVANEAQLNVELSDPTR